MHIQITDLAAQRLTESLNDQPGYFKVFYDMEGCGCNGIVVLLIVDEPAALDEQIETNLVPFYVDPKHQLNLESSMKLDSQANYSAYTLSSDSGVISSNLRLRDARAAAVGTASASDACML
ncbi:iron-sulfur cluster biosynthesis family protein [Paenibacillus silvae]|uniref:iron-sulfur cluster biosynthesis family protein n=1 Tax=Paenibacillus silvae TaxID=1325358 RepID=UPI00200425AD|nr:iron-sulfur cluster biosynthesis family protein [Paenibacillus silvae]MCK6073671.1 iron-sulfur cluster biosynthesis family protein [Paenibacillus silvae]MCK6148853.1 iron-sulfur cluster biosynthesis family protein [Paenibacillus silvae]MCK6267153.1 iron-sulfur cluster biosynthesis family protein [Paenibacillus silvae]